MHVFFSSDDIKISNSKKNQKSLFFPLKSLKTWKISKFRVSRNCYRYLLHNSANFDGIWLRKRIFFVIQFSLRPLSYILNLFCLSFLIILPIVYQVYRRGGEMDLSKKGTRRLEIIFKKLLERVKIWIYPNAYIHWTHIYM